MKIKTNVTKRRKARSSNLTPYPHPKWHGDFPGNHHFGPPAPVWNAPPPLMQLWPAFMPQNQQVAYNPQRQFVPYNPQNTMMAYDPQYNMVPYGPPPPLFPNVPPHPPQYLYHYTDHTGMCSILGESYIRKSCPAQTNTTAWYGEGVYLTAVPPSAPDSVILMNNWNDDGFKTPNSAWNGSKAARLQYCFVIFTMNLTPWALEKVWNHKGRNIWVYRSEIPLGGKVVALKRRW